MTHPRGVEIVVRIEHLVVRAHKRIGKLEATTDVQQPFDSPEITDHRSHPTVAELHEQVLSVDFRH